MWKLENYYYSGDTAAATYATANSTDYPFGTLEWEVHGDEGCSGENNTGRQLVTLNLSTCRQGEFNCADGSCVDIGLRCDGNIDCPDKTGNEYQDPPNQCWYEPHQHLPH